MAGGRFELPKAFWRNPERRYSLPLDFFSASCTPRQLLSPAPIIGLDPF